MIDLIKLLLALSLPTFIGFVIVSIVSAKSKLLSDLEKIALSFLIGNGTLTLIILLLGVCRIQLIWPNILIASIILLAAPIFICIKNHFLTLDFGSWLKTERFNWLELSVMLIILFRAGFVLFENLIKPVIGVDAFANWSLRAKTFFVEGSLILDPKSNSFLGSGQIFYPINIPLTQTWIYNVLGYWNDELCKIIFGLFLIAILTLFYCTVKRSSSRKIALLGTYLLTTLSLLIFHATIEYSDFPLACYFTASAFLLFNYFESEDIRYLFLSALLGGIATWTKSEGMLLLMVSMLILGIFYIRVKKPLITAALLIGQFFAVAMIFKLPWSIINIVYHIPKNAYQQIEFDKIFTNLYRVPVILQVFYEKMFFYGNWNIAWFALIIVGIISFRKFGTRSIYSLLYIGIFVPMIAFMYYITENYIWLLDGTTLNRNLLLIMPLVIYFITVNLSGIFTPPPAEEIKPIRGKKNRIRK